MSRKKIMNRNDSEGLLGYLKNNPIIIAALIIVLGFLLFKGIQYVGCASHSGHGLGWCMMIDLTK